MNRDELRVEHRALVFGGRWSTELIAAGLLGRRGGVAFRVGDDDQGGRPRVVRSVVDRAGVVLVEFVRGSARRRAIQPVPCGPKRRGRWGRVWEDERHAGRSYR